MHVDVCVRHCWSLHLGTSSLTLAPHLWPAQCFGTRVSSSTRAVNSEEVTSASTRQMNEVDLSEPSKRMDGSSNAQYRSALSGSTVGSTEVGEGGTVFYSSVAEQIEKSKPHWSVLAESDATDEGDDEEAEVSNVRVFQALQSKWGDDFFFLFNDGQGSTLEVGEKFAEGGQAELFHAKVRWRNPTKNEDDRKEGREWVLKVFKKGASLSSLQTQWPQGLLQFQAEEAENWKSPTPIRLPRFYCNVYLGTLLEDGRFAFLMVKEDFDLRSLIERNMELRRDKGGGPFSKGDAEYIMYSVALGMDWLHSRDIVHRDLKASNVLVYEFRSGRSGWHCLVADYECSVGVVGTGFFRAPEILQALKERRLSQKPEVFSKAVDVYSYGMTCYEILTGKFPLEGHPGNDFDLVLSGQRPAVPEYVPDWTRGLLSRCWQSNPRARPAFGEILDLISKNSTAAREFEASFKAFYGENFRSWHLNTVANPFLRRVRKGFLRRVREGCTKARLSFSGLHRWHQI